MIEHSVHLHPCAILLPLKSICEIIDLTESNGLNNLKGQVDETDSAKNEGRCTGHNQGSYRGMLVHVFYTFTSGSGSESVAALHVRRSERRYDGHRLIRQQPDRNRDTKHRHQCGVLDSRVW